jgi:HEAT repeat protein
LQDPSERREAAATLANVIKSQSHPDIDGVLATYQSAVSQPLKLTLIDIMGQVSAKEALPLLRSSLKDANQETARAAILALTAWQTPDPLPDLLAVAKSDPNVTRQILALRGVIKLLSVTSDRSPDQTVALLSEVWKLARQPAEKRSILALLPIYATPGALQMAEAAVNDPTVTAEAKAAVENIRLLGIL